MKILRAPTAGQVLFGLAVAVALVFASGAAAAKPTSHGRVYPLTGAKPMRVCSRAPARSGRAACSAVGLARNGRFIPLSASVVPHGSMTPAQSGLVPATATVQPVTPDILHAAYLLPTTSAGSSSQTIGIVDAFDDPTVKADLDKFDTEFGLPALPNCSSTVHTSCFQKVNQAGGTTFPAFNSGWSLEVALDVETAHAVCQNCKILLVEATTNSFADLGAAVTRAATMGATVISNSYGAAESGFTLSQFNASAPPYRQSGVTIVASAGDDGWGPQFPADVNNVVAVGGTTLHTDDTSGAWSGETTWWDGTQGTGSGCSGFETAQSWQTAATGWLGTSCGTARGIADVAADADPNSGMVLYWSADHTECTAPDCFWIVGGTSFSAPVISAIYALAANASTLTNPGRIPYLSPGSLHDVTSGSNGSCPGATTICNAGPGYDGPTGLGTPMDIAAFVGPTISSFSPGSGRIGSTVILSGRHFTGATAVEFHGTNADSFTVDNDSQITALVAAGTTSGTVTVDSTAGPIVSATPFNVLPTIDSFTPTHAAEGGAVAITGSGFTGATAVSFGGQAQTFHLDSDTQITVSSIAAGTATGHVAVTTPVGTDTSSGLLFITPGITTVSPSSGAVHSSVTITGTSFTGATSVKLNGTSVPFTVASGTKITFTVPVGATSGTISVTTPGGAATSTGSFTVLGAPTITSFTPGSGPVGTPVTITGTNLGDVVGVSIGTTITVPTSVSPTQVVFSIPPGAATGAIRLLARNGSVTSLATFTVTS
jgi:subtilase family serine protease